MGIQDRDWYWEAREASQRVLPRNERLEVNLFWKIVGGVFLGTLLAAVVFFGYQEFRVRQAAAEAIRKLERERAASVAQESQRRAAVAREQVVRQIEDEQRKAAEASARAARGEQRVAKDAAWARFYKRPAHCETAADVECANHFIRAKREFEARWERANP